MEILFQEDPGACRLVGGWLRFALGAIALATVFSLLIVATKTPLLGSFSFAETLFRKALVMHVSFALVVWFFACAAAMWVLAAGRSCMLRRAALALSSIGAAAMAVAPFIGTPQPVLSNYIPVLDSRIFLGGLTLFTAGVVLSGIGAAADIVRRQRGGQFEAWRFGVLLSMAAAVVALGSFAASMAATGVPSDQAGFELLFWGPGHVLQYAHTLLMLAIWIILGERVLGAPVASQRWLSMVLLLEALPLLAAPVIHLMYPVDSADFRLAFTSLMVWGSWPAILLLIGSLLPQMMRAGRAAWTKPEALPLGLSMLLVIFGCIAGAFIRGETTMVTAHYHGTVGAITISYMGFGYYLLRAFGFSVKSPKLARWQLSLYGGGLLMLSASLAWLGLLGSPRKTPHSELLAQSVLAFSGMELGAMLSMIGDILLIFIIVRSIRQSGQQKPRSRDVRLNALTLTFSLIVIIGLTVAYLPSWLDSAPAQKKSGDARIDHVQEKTAAEIRQRFEQGVAMLNAKEYEHALTAFHRVLQLEPAMPEAHVNIGFALIGLKRYDIARDFFESAIELRRDQMNAYYGLAEALEGLNDIPGALGAMRTFVHRAPASDPFRARAEAAVWEWEVRLMEERNKVAPIKPAKKSGAQKSANQ